MICKGCEFNIDDINCELFGEVVDGISSCSETFVIEELLKRYRKLQKRFMKRNERSN